MQDNDVLGRIDELVKEEHELMKRAEHGGLDDAERERLKAVEVRLDQCWDLLRQRRARREYGQNPDDASVRDASTVEKYKQ